MTKPHKHASVHRAVHWEGLQLSLSPALPGAALLTPEAWQASEETICLAEAQAGVVPRRDRLGGDAHLTHERHLDAVDSGRPRRARALPRKWAEPEVVVVRGWRHANLRRRYGNLRWCMGAMLTLLLCTCDAHAMPELKWWYIAPA